MNRLICAILLPVFSLLFFVNSTWDGGATGKCLSMQGSGRFAHTTRFVINKAHNNKYRKTAHPRALDDNQAINIGDCCQSHSSTDYFVRSDFSSYKGAVCKLYFSRVKLRGPPSSYGA